MPYTVPAGYFNQNLEVLPALLKEEEAPVLAAIGKDLPYTVPQGYFKNLPEQVLAKITKPQAKVVPLFARKWMKVAVAAVVGGVMVLAGYQLLNDKKEITITGHQPAGTSQTSVAKNESAIAQEIKKISTRELEEFINNTPLNLPKQQKQDAKPQEKKEVEQLLKDVTASEIDAFLKQIPTADDDDLQLIN